jgi:hypothetical protein
MVIIFIDSYLKLFDSGRRRTTVASFLVSIGLATNAKIVAEVAFFRPNSNTPAFLVICEASLLAPPAMLWFH